MKTSSLPKINPFKELYWKQFGGGPDAAMLKKMDPANPLGLGKPAKQNRKNKPNRMTLTLLIPTCAGISG